MHLAAAGVLDSTAICMPYSPYMVIKGVACGVTRVAPYGAFVWVRNSTNGSNGKVL
jgi:hypothetical protein